VEDSTKVWSKLELSLNISPFGLYLERLIGFKWDGTHEHKSLATASNVVKD